MYEESEINAFDSSYIQKGYKEDKFMIAIAVNIAINTVLKLLVLRLLTFHIWLKRNNLTTF